jgi:hypothetical protein
LHFVDGQAADLSDTRIGLERLHLDARPSYPFQRPGMCVRSDNHAQVWPAGSERVDQLDGARGVTEAVTGNVEDESQCELLIADC